MEGLDWSDPQLLNAIEADCINGFGFQCETTRSCMYLGQPFLAQPIQRQITNYPWPSYEIDETKFLADIHGVLRPLGVPDEGVWITDYLGHNFLTIHTRYYNQIPNIINACLQCGYKFLTHGEWKAQFMPGEEFDRISFENHLIDTLEMHEREMRKAVPNISGDQLYYAGIRPFTKIWNYATPRGREFCTQLRQKLRKRKPVSAFNDRYNWPWFQEVTHKYGVLYAGGWAQFTPRDGEGHALDAAVPPAKGGGNEEPPVKRASPERNIVPPAPEGGGGNDEEEPLCLVCMEKAPNTLVLPCQHCVVCDKCSPKLDVTADKATCMQCRRPITDVFYPSGAHVKK